MVEGTKEIYGATFRRALIPFMGVLPSGSNPLQRPHLLIPTLRVGRISTYEFWGETNFPFMAEQKQKTKATPASDQDPYSIGQKRQTWRMSSRRENKVGDVLSLADNLCWFSGHTCVLWTPLFFCRLWFFHLKLLCLGFSLAWLKATEFLSNKNYAVILQILQTLSLLVLQFSGEAPKWNSAPMHCRICLYYFPNPVC